MLPQTCIIMNNVQEQKTAAIICRKVVIVRFWQLYYLVPYTPCIFLLYILIITLLDLEHLDSVTDKEDSESEYCPSEHSSILTEANSNKDEILNEINGSKESSGSKQNSKNNSGIEVSVQANESGVFCPDDVDLNIDPSQGPKDGNKKNCCFY